MNFTTDQSCDHAVLKSSIHAEKSERSKNSHLNLLYTHCNSSVVCNNYLISAVSTSLDCELCCAAAANKRKSVKDFFRSSLTSIIVYRITHYSDSFFSFL